MRTGLEDCGLGSGDSAEWSREGLRIRTGDWEDGGLERPLSVFELVSVVIQNNYAVSPLG
jgi:hypothetical protein